MKKQYIAAGVLVAAMSVVVACGGGGGGTNSPVLPTTAPAPTAPATNTPTAGPTGTPTVNPSGSPTVNPSESPTLNPTESPTPTIAPTGTPRPTFTPLPTATPTLSPTPSPMPSYLPDTVWPVFDCVSNVKSTFYWEFGYINSGSGSKSFTPGSDKNLILINGVAPSPQPQPSSFPSNSGVETYRYFKVQIPGTGEQAVTWTLDGNTIGPYGKEGVPACPE